MSRSSLGLTALRMTVNRTSQVLHYFKFIFFQKHVFMAYLVMENELFTKDES